MEDNNLFYATSKDTTPMISQYLAVKSQYPGCLLLFRMGDFYEMFFDDAKTAAPILNIALTSRGKHLDEDIPMCGVPVLTLDNYLGRLVKHGHKVAICEQTEDPKEAKKRGGYKAIVKREVIRIITPGTIIDDSLLNSRINNFLMSVIPEVCKRTAKIKTVSFATIDISTGDFFVNTVMGDEFSAAIEMYQPKELLIPSSYERSEFASGISNYTKALITYLPDSKFNPIVEEERLKRFFKVRTLESFGISSDNELATCGAILEYILITQKENLSTLPAPKKTVFSDYLVIDSATSKSLEIVCSSHGEYRYSLLGAVDKTSTPFGARALAARIATPIVDRERIIKRLDCVDFFIKNEKITKLIRETLSKCPDFERAINRIKFNKFSVRDVGDIRESLRIIHSIKNIVNGINVPSEGDYFCENISDFSELQQLLEKALVETLPATGNRDGGIIAAGYSKKLDELKYLKNHSEDMISNLQAQYISETSVGNLKIKNNGILGWYIEIPISQKHKMSDKFIHRQTLINAVRYITEELVNLQTQLSEANDEWLRMEQQLYAEIIEKIMVRYDDISYAIKLLSCLDIYTNFAHISTERNYVRPEITGDPILEIKNGLHPILAIHCDNFTSNHCDLNADGRLCILTGPNMAGKSTYLRQNALIVILAQVGCYVPAESATIGIVDRLFSRIGASDDIARGRSTFLVEMIETATILNQATERSFVILDEVGRGTSTYDGLAIAWSVVEYLCKNNRCRVLFATHYRELTALQNTLKDIRCKTLKVQEWNGEVIFYHKIIDGIADRSYGIHVAGIAGVPKAVVKRATDLLKKFEEDKKSSKGPKISTAVFDTDMCLAEQMDLLGQPTENDRHIRETIQKVDLNTLTPKQALDILYDLKEMLV
jgi:DNA mismatch repair protein MutS